MANYLIAGGSGFIGTKLGSILLSLGHQVSILTTQKNIHRKQKDIQMIYWNPNENLIDESIQLQEYKVINLAGAGVADQRWTKARKLLLLQSRTNALHTLLKAHIDGKIQITHLCSSSAIGYYGNQIGVCTEDQQGDESFLSQICQQWEQATLPFQKAGIPVAIVRTGIVFGKEKGALYELLKPLKYGVIAIPGDGHQIYSWIHHEDICQLMIYLSVHCKQGIFNGVSPNPVSLNVLFEEIALHKKRVWLKMHISSWMIQWIVGEMAIEVLKSAEVSSTKIVHEGFQFKFPKINQALKDLLN